MKIDFDTRIKHVTDSLKYLSLPAILVLSPSNIKFLTGFSGSNCCLLITTQNIYFFTDSRYLEDSKNKFTSWIVAKYSRDFKEIHEVLNELNIRKVGYEAKKITQFDFENPGEVSSILFLTNLSISPPVIPFVTELIAIC